MTQGGIEVVQHRYHREYQLLTSNHQSPPLQPYKHDGILCKSQPPTQSNSTKQPLIDPHRTASSEEIFVHQTHSLSGLSPMLYQSPLRSHRPRPLSRLPLPHRPDSSSQMIDIFFSSRLNNSRTISTHYGISINRSVRGSTKYTVLWPRETDKNNAVLYVKNTDPLALSQ